MEKKETFASLMQSFGYRHDLRSFFDDFLTLVISALARNYKTGKSEDEELYLSIIGKYEKEIQDKFPKLFGLLVLEMDERIATGQNPDVLGEFYEQNLSRKGASQYFTPWNACQLMTEMTMQTDWEKMLKSSPLRVLDPCCGSGRMLLAGVAKSKRKNEYYGIDIDLTCVKMTAINLFLNGAFNSEVMCANSLMSDDFRVSYKVSFLPLGIYRVTEKSKSKLWRMHQNSFNKGNPENPVNPETPQLRLF